MGGGAAGGDFFCARLLSAASHNSLRSDRCSAAEAAQKKSSNPRKASHPLPPLSRLVVTTLYVLDWVVFCENLITTRKNMSCRIWTAHIFSVRLARQFCYFITIRLMFDQGLNTFVLSSLVRFQAWRAM